MLANILLDGKLKSQFRLGTPLTCVTLIVVPCNNAIFDFSLIFFFSYECKITSLSLCSLKFNNRKGIYISEIDTIPLNT